MAFGNLLDGEDPFDTCMEVSEYYKCSTRANWVTNSNTCH